MKIIKGYSAKILNKFLADGTYFYKSQYINIAYYHAERR